MDLISSRTDEEVDASSRGMSWEEVEYRRRIEGGRVPVGEDHAASSLVGCESSRQRVGRSREGSPVDSIEQILAMPSWEVSKHHVLGPWEGKGCSWTWGRGTARGMIHLIRDMQGRVGQRVDRTDRRSMVPVRRDRELGPGKHWSYDEGILNPSRQSPRGVGTGLGFLARSQIFRLELLPRASLEEDWVSTSAPTDSPIAYSPCRIHTKPRGVYRDAGISPMIPKTA